MQGQHKTHQRKKLKKGGGWEYRKGILYTIAVPNSMTIPNCRVIGFRIDL